MLAFPEMLISPAEKAGIKTPPNANKYDKNEYSHFHVFCTIQLGQPLPHPTAHWENAEVIAVIPMDKIQTVTWNELVDLGLQVGYPTP